MILFHIFLPFLLKFGSWFNKLPVLVLKNGWLKMRLINKRRVPINAGSTGPSFK